MKRTVAEHFADRLVAAGVDQVFAVTGGGAMFLNQALGRHERIRCTFMHHEQACSMAAEGYARIAGKPAVVMVTSGPGAINALNGVFGAFTDSIPMIVFSGQVKLSTSKDALGLENLRQLGDQEGPTIAMASPICKFAKLVGSASEAIQCLEEALAIVETGRPGPVWLDIPLDIQSAEIEFAPITNNRTGYRAIRKTDRLIANVSEVVKRLLNSNRPVVLGGTGVRLAGQRDRLLRLIERLSLPMATAWTHDLIPSDHPLNAGRPGTIGTRSGNFVLQAADFVLVLGSRLNVRQTSYNFEKFAAQAWVAQVDIDPAELEKPTVQPDLGIEADISEFLDVFESQIDQICMPDYSKWTSWIQETHVRFNVLREHSPTNGEWINPYFAVNAVFKQIDSDSIIVCGNASACILPFQVGSISEDQRMFSNSGSASMGYDLPASIGAAMAAPARRIICFAGDGSIQMNIQELQTIKTHNLSICIVVINNAGYASIKQTHENFFGNKVGADWESGVEFPNYVAIAQAYGIRAIEVREFSALSDLRKVIERNDPVLINIISDPNQGFAPRIKSRVDENGQFQTPELDDMYPFLPPEEITAVRRDAISIKSHVTDTR